jgi:SAM-dependent methyltransferase
MNSSVPVDSGSGGLDSVASTAEQRHVRDISVPVGVLRTHCRKRGVDTAGSVLVLGAASDDIDILRAAGFNNLTPSNMNTGDLRINAEAIAFEDETFDMVFAHATLHHCHSPYKALAEMLRVARSWVAIFEPNDSVPARFAEFLRIKHPYEIVAVTANEKGRGGVMDSDVPNYIHRWSPRELKKTALSAQPDRQLLFNADRYWDFNLTRHEIELSSPIAGRVKRLMQMNRGLLNFLPVVRSQGNHFFGLVSKSGYQPWIKDGHFDPDYLTS